MSMKIAMFKQTAATVSLMSLLWLLYTLTIPGPSQAAIFFDTSFETCAVGTGNDFPCEGWDDFGQESVGFLRVVTTNAFTGSKSLKLTYNNINGSSQQPSIYHTLPGLNHIFLRFAMYQAAGFQYGSNGGTKRIRFRAPSGYPIFWVYTYFGGYAINIEAPYDGLPNGLWITSGVSPTANAWDQIETEILINTPGQSDGLVRLWINGTLRAESLNRQWVGPTPTSIGPSGLPTGSNWLANVAQVFLQSGVGDLYYDRIAVGDTRIGPVQSTSADSKPPASPKDFQAR